METKRPQAGRHGRGLDLVGIGLVGAAVGWTVITALIAGGRASPFVMLLLACAAAVAVVRRLPATGLLAALALIAAAPVLAAAFHLRPLHGAGPLGYANASGTLFLVAAAAAATAGLCLRDGRWRTLAIALAAAWILAPWAARATTAGLFAAALPICALLIRRPRAARGLALAGAAAVLAGLLVAGALGHGYEPGGRDTAVERLVDATMGELRVVLWGEALDLIRAAPATGVGARNFQQAAPTAVARDDARWAHNEFLQVGAESGVPGTLLVLGLVLWALALLGRAASDPRTVPAIVATTGVAVNANIDYVGHFPAVTVALAGLVAAAARIPETLATPAPRASGPLRTAALATLAAWAVLMLPVEALNPRHAKANAVTWISEAAGIRLAGAGGARTAGSPGGLYRRLASSQAFSMELSAAAARQEQSGPARIVSASRGTSHRNITLGQEGDALVLRLRTTGTDWNGHPQLVVGGVFATTGLQHIVVATDLVETTVYVDGAVRWHGPGPGGTLDNWNRTYPLLLGNELGGDRPWSGEIRYLAVHDRVLTTDEVQAAAAARHAPPDQQGAVVPQPALAYTFREGAGSIIGASGPAAADGDLLIPERFPAPAAGFGSAFLGMDRRTVPRGAVHVLVFAVWAALLLRSFAGRPAPAAWGIPVGALALVLAASWIRYLSGGTPSVLDLAAAASGAAAGLFLAHRHRATHRPADLPAPTRATEVDG